MNKYNKNSNIGRRSYFIKYFENYLINKLYKLKSLNLLHKNDN